MNNPPSVCRHAATLPVRVSAVGVHHHHRSGNTPGADNSAGHSFCHRPPGGFFMPFLMCFLVALFFWFLVRRNI
jgi:hypothetical protein